MTFCDFCGAQARWSFEATGAVVHGPKTISLCTWHIILYYLALQLKPRG